VSGLRFAPRHFSGLVLTQEMSLSASQCQVFITRGLCTMIRQIVPVEDATVLRLKHFWPSKIRRKVEQQAKVCGAVVLAIENKLVQRIMRLLEPMEHVMIPVEAWRTPQMFSQPYITDEPLSRRNSRTRLSSRLGKCQCCWSPHARANGILI
jgi:hypothetical protein